MSVDNRKLFNKKSMTFTNGSNRTGFCLSFVAYCALVTRCKLNVFDEYDGACVGALENRRDCNFCSLTKVGGTIISEATRTKHIKDYFMCIKESNIATAKQNFRKMEAQKQIFLPVFELNL